LYCRKEYVQAFVSKDDSARAVDAAAWNLLSLV
jgi:hypothetical protein